MSMTNGQTSLYEFGPFRLNSESRVLLRDGEVVPLPPKALDTLVLLVRNSGRALDKDALMKELWPDTFVEEANLAQHISVLRKALGESPTEPQYIETIPRRGYRFLAKVAAIADGHALVKSPASGPAPSRYPRIILALFPVAIFLSGIL